MANHWCINAHHVVCSVPDRHQSFASEFVRQYNELITIASCLGRFHTHTVNCLDEALHVLPHRIHYVNCLCLSTHTHTYTLSIALTRPCTSSLTAYIMLIVFVCQHTHTLSIALMRPCTSSLTAYIMLIVFVCQHTHIHTHCQLPWWGLARPPSPHTLC